MKLYGITNMSNIWLRSYLSDRKESNAEKFMYISPTVVVKLQGFISVQYIEANEIICKAIITSGDRIILIKNNRCRHQQTGSHTFNNVINWFSVMV